MQSVLEACDGNMDKAKAWLLDMDPFVAEDNELPHQLLPMYAEDNTGKHSVEANSGIGEGGRSIDTGSGDLYWAHRQGAVKLSREWRKLFRKCVAARPLIAPWCTSS